MKNVSLLILIGLAIAGCGGGKKNPVGSDLASIRKDGKEVTEMGPQKPREVTKTIVVEHEKEVTKEAKTIDGNLVEISSQPEMSFTEGKESSYKVQARVFMDGVEVALTTSELPRGMSFKASESEKGVYLLSWNPELNTIPANSSMKTLVFKITAKVTSTGKLKNLVKEKDISLFVFRTQEQPSDLKVLNLPTEIMEGSEPTAFTVTVKVPGMNDKAPQKPRLVVSYDGQSSSAGNNFLELDGSRHIVADLNKKEPKYLGNFVWEYSLLFDAKNISVQPQLAKDNSVMQNADGTRVRFNLKAYSGYGLYSPDTVYQIKIKYNKPITSPRFDLSGLAQQALEVSRGETINLKFVVSSSDSKSQVSVTSQATNLPGSPTVVCKSSSQGANKQNCLLNWKVPCDANIEDLNSEIGMVATDNVTEPTNYSLKTKAAGKEKKLCTNKRK